jgi:hypothetical protein
VIQAFINNSRSPQRDNIAPITAFSGLPADTPLLWLDTDPAGQVLSIFERASQVISISDLRESVEALHKRCNAAVAACRDCARAAHASKRGIAVLEFDVGEFVLKIQHDPQAHDKLSLK